MTGSESRTPPRPIRVESGEGSGVREAGRIFLRALHTTFRSVKLYPMENEQTQRAFEDLAKAAAVLHQKESELEVRVAGEFMFVNAMRLRLDVDEQLSELRDVFTIVGVGGLHVGETVQRSEWQEFISALVSFSGREPDAVMLAQLQEHLKRAGVTRLTVEAPPETEEPDEDRAKEVAKRTYERSVAVTKEIVNSVRMGRTANANKVKRAVQGVVDQVLTNETSILGLTTIRDYDEYTFTHSVNVCTFSVAIGKRLGLTKLQLYDLGMAALFHDVGKNRVPVEVLNKTSGLDEKEWNVMRAHPWLGALTQFQFVTRGDLPYRGIIGAYEHHMKIDLTGYPTPKRPRQLSLFSKIIAVADGFDAATTRRSYQTVPIQPDQVLREMWANPRRGYDRVLVKELINLVGIYPVGTCLVLDSGEVAMTHSVNPNTTHLNRPVVRIVVTADGNRLEDGPLVDLAEVDAQGNFGRSIVRVADPSAYGINPSDYFV